jgi:hypothetical protein
LEVEPERIEAQVEGVMEKMVLHGHVRSAERMSEALRTLGGQLKSDSNDKNNNNNNNNNNNSSDEEGAGWMKDHYKTMAMLLGIAQTPTGTVSLLSRSLSLQHTYLKKKE